MLFGWRVRTSKGGWKSGECSGSERLVHNLRMAIWRGLWSLDNVGHVLWHEFRLEKNYVIGTFMSIYRDEEGGGGEGGGGSRRVVFNQAGQVGVVVSTSPLFPFPRCRRCTTTYA